MQWCMNRGKIEYGWHIRKITYYEWNLCISEKTTNFVGLIATKCAVGEERGSRWVTRKYIIYKE